MSSVLSFQSNGRAGVAVKVAKGILRGNTVAGETPNCNLLQCLSIPLRWWLGGVHASMTLKKTKFPVLSAMTNKLATFQPLLSGLRLSNCCPEESLSIQTILSQKED